MTQQKEVEILTNELADSRDVVAELFTQRDEQRALARAVLQFIESHKTALIGNECTADEYERVMLPFARALRE